MLYLTLVRSQFEHCSIIWRPQNKTSTNKLENLQKRAVKWILCEEYTSYSLNMYIQKCRQLNILPLSTRFDFLDILFFYKVTRLLYYVYYVIHSITTYVTYSDVVSTLLPNCLLLFNDTFKYCNFSGFLFLTLLISIREILHFQQNYWN